jgi:hypothetical protein
MSRPAKASREVRAWMAKNGIRVKELAAELGVNETGGFVSHFIKGESGSAAMRAIFIRRGCPERLMAGLDALRARKRRTGGAK